MLPKCSDIDYNDGMKGEEQHPKKQSFMREKVVKRGSWKKRLFRAVRVIFCAILFGLTACFVFVCAKPWMEEKLYPEEETTQAPILLPSDEEPTDPTKPPETTEASTEETSPDDRSLEERIEEILERQTPDREDLKNLDTLMTGWVREVNQGIVILTAADPTGADSGFRAGKERAAGALFMMTDSEGLILTDCSRMDGCQDFLVQFYNGAVGRGSLKQADTTTGIAVIRVDRQFLDAAEIVESEVLRLGSSYSAAAGQTVLMAGCPYGQVYSAAIGRIACVENGVTGVDTERRWIYADLTAAGSGFLVNMDREIIGVVTSDMLSAASEGYTGFLAISDLKGSIEKLVNGKGIACLGVRGASVTAERSEQTGMPAGLYITEVVQGGPAYNSGIQPGDVLTAINETGISGMKELQNSMMMSEPGQELRVAVMRLGKEGYAEQIYAVTAGAR